VSHVWRSAAYYHIKKLLVIQFKCLRIATNAPWYIGNKEIHDDLRAPFFTNHITSVTEWFNLKLADGGVV
jgi:hypothetical protein